MKIDQQQIHRNPHKFTAIITQGTQRMIEVLVLVLATAALATSTVAFAVALFQLAVNNGNPPFSLNFGLVGALISWGGGIVEGSPLDCHEKCGCSFYQEEHYIFLLHFCVP